LNIGRYERNSSELARKLDRKVIHDSSNMTLDYYLFHALPRSIIQDLIFGEMLALSDIARLEVAAAVHRIHRSQVGVQSLELNEHISISGIIGV
jgi:hypothetical protein